MLHHRSYLLINLTRNRVGNITSRHEVAARKTSGCLLQVKQDQDHSSRNVTIWRAIDATAEYHLQRR